MRSRKAKTALRASIIILFCFGDNFDRVRKKSTRAIDFPYSPHRVSFFKEEETMLNNVYLRLSFSHLSAGLVTVCGITVNDFGILGKIGIGLLVDVIVGLVVTWIDLGRLRLCMRF